MNSTQIRKSFLYQFLVLALSALLLAMILTPVQAAPDATITVNSTADVDDGYDNQCTLREAITAANTDTASGPAADECPAGSGADTISLPAGTYTLSITGTEEDHNETGDLDVRSEVTINGAGAGSTIIEAGTTDSNGIDRVLHVVDSGDELTLDGVTVRHGRNTNGGGVINLYGVLTIENSTISDNTAPDSGGGGGVYSYSGTMTIENSTLSGNSADAFGGGVYMDVGSVIIRNSTLSGNSTTLTGGSGGGGVFIDGGTLTFEHSTITNNISDTGKGIANNGGTVNLKNTIVAGNGTGGSDDCYNGSGSINSLGYNLVGDGTGCPSGGTGDLTTSDPKLDPLADNGGPTETHALQTDSPALNAIPSGTNGCGTTYIQDQRGETRPQLDACDVGSFELVVSTRTWDGDAGDGLWSTAANWDYDALPAADATVLLDNADPTAITMDTNVTIQNLTISGSGVTLSPGGATSLDLEDFTQSSGAFSPPSAMTVSGDFDHSGGTFTNNNGTVTFDGSTTQIYSGTTLFNNVTVESGSTLELGTDSDFGYAGNLTLDGNLDVTSNTPNTVRLAWSGTQSLPSGLNSFHSLAINSGATLSAPSSLTLAGDLTNDGAFTHNNGTVTFNGGGTQIYDGTTVFHDVTVESGSALQLAAISDFGYDNAFTLNGSLDTTTAPPNTVRLAYSGTQSLPSGATTLHSLVIESGATLSAPSDLYIAGDWTNNGTFVHNNEHVWFNGSGAQTLSGDTTFHSLFINNTSPSEKVDASGSTLKVDRTLDVIDGIFRSASDYEDVDISSNGTLELSGDITVSLNWENDGAFIHNNHRVTFDGSTGQGFTGTTIFHDVTVESGTGLVMQANSEFGYSGTFTLNGSFNATLYPPTTVRLAWSGTQALPSGATTLHSLVIDSGATLTAPTGDLFIAGDWTDNGGFHGNGGTVIFDGSGIQTMNGVTVFHDLTVEGGSTLQLATDAVLGYSGEIIADGTLDLLTNAPTTLMVSGARFITPPNQTTHNLVINDSLLGYWKFDEGSGTTTADSSGFGHDGVLEYDTAWVTDTPATDFANPSALSFDGSDDFVDIAGTPEIDELQEFTIATWVYINSFPAFDARFVTLRNEKAVLRYDDQATGQLHFYVKIDGVLNHIRVDGALTTGTWLHIAGSYDGSTMRVYLNGLELDNLSVSGTVATGNGIHLSSSSAALDGLLDDVRVYNRVLDESEFGALANGEHPLGTYNVYTSLSATLDVEGDLVLNSGQVYQPQVEAYWNLDEGSGSTAADSSGNSHDGALQNDTTWTTDTPPTVFSNPSALSFDGTTDYVEVPHSTDLDTGEELTLSAWVKLNDSSVDQKIVGKTNGAHNSGYVLGVKNNALFPEIWDSSGGYFAQEAGTISSDTWTHLAVTWKTSGQMIGYINGTEVFNIVASTKSIGASTNPLRIGVAPWDINTYSVNGLVDDVRVYDWALSSSDIQDLAYGYAIRSHDIHIAGDFIRNGGYVYPGDGTVTFDGTGTQTLDTDAITFYNMTVNSGVTLVDLAEFSVEGALTNNGALQKTQAVTGSSDVNFFDTGGYGGLTLNANGSDLGSTTVTITGDQDCTNVAGETVRRCFDIAPANTTGLSATVTFYLAASELSGNTCSTLDAYHWNGGGWVAESTASRSCASEPYSIQSTGVSDFSPFALKSGSGPTAVTLRDFTARPGAGEVLVDMLRWNALPLVLLAAALVLLSGGIVWLLKPHFLKKRG